MAPKASKTATPKTAKKTVLQPKSKRSPAQAKPQAASSRGQKRKSPEKNPFECSPDTNQASILAFTKSRDTQEQPSQPREDTPPDTVVASSTAEASTNEVDGSNAADQAFAELARGDKIDLQQVVMTIRALTDKKVYNPNMMDQLTGSFEDDEFEALLTQCRSHHRFDAHVQSVREELAGEEWTFGDHTGDALCDLQGMIDWLVPFAHDDANYQRPESSELDPASTAEAGNTMDYKTRVSTVGMVAPLNSYMGRVYIRSRLLTTQSNLTYQQI